MAYGTRRSNAAFIRALQLSIFWAEWIRLLVKHLLYFFKIKSNILPSTPRFSVRLTVNVFKVVLTPSILATCPAYLSNLDLITLFMLDEQYKLGGSLFKFKRKIWNWTGIWTSDLHISSLALYHLSYPGSNFSLEFKL